MQGYLLNLRTICVGLAAVILISCDDDTESHLRPSIDYSTLTPATPYSEMFVDASGNTTVDLADGNNRHKMFQALNYYSSSSTAANAHIDAPVLNSMFSNVGNPFTDISTSSISVTGATLNASGVNLRDVVALSRPASEAEAVRVTIEGHFEEIEEISHFVSDKAESGKAGKLTVPAPGTGSYLVNAKGIEVIQIIQKSLIGALQLDYIGNVLMDEGLQADNHSTVPGKNYTTLEHNWDVAYGLLTLNPVYLAGATDQNRGTTEFAGGSYIWEYNKASYAKIHPAFLKGRAAIVNNDMAELQVQATFIRTEFEKAIAAAALGYLDKWKTGNNDAARAHAIGEGLGFIYSLRFATVHKGDAAFSDSILNNLIESPNGFWDLNAAKINAASDAIKSKFNMQ